MKTIKEVSVDPTINKGLCMQAKDEIAEYSFSAGIEFAQKWISVNDELPPEDELVLCKMKSNEAVVAGYIMKINGKLEVCTNPDFHFEDYGHYEPIEWRRLEFE